MRRIQEAIMASYKAGKDEAIAWIRDNFAEGSTALDVGCCDGKWSDLLEGYLNLDGIEAFEPNITKHNLKAKYRRIINQDITNFKYEWYDLIIFGDVIEHMTVEQAQKVLEYARPRCKNMIVAVPFLHIQGMKYNNPYEVHKQPDLTNTIFQERYKGFKPIFINTKYAYYIKETED